MDCNSKALALKLGYNLKSSNLLLVSNKTTTFTTISTPIPMAKKVKNGANKKLHSKLIKNKKQKVADKKTARELKLKAMYQKLNSEREEEE